MRIIALWVFATHKKAVLSFASLCFYLGSPATKARQTCLVLFLLLIHISLSMQHRNS